MVKNALIREVNYGKIECVSGLLLYVEELLVIYWQKYVLMLCSKFSFTSQYAVNFI